MNQFSLYAFHLLVESFRRQVPIIYMLATTQSPPIVGSLGSIKIWDLVSGKQKDHIYIGSPVLHIIWVDINSLRNTLLTACEDGSISIYSCPATLLRDFLYFYQPNFSSHLGIFTSKKVHLRH